MMITPLVTAFAATLGCASADAPARCAPIEPARTLVIHRRRSCAGLTRIEKLYSVGVERGIVCLPLSSIVAGGGRT